MPGLRPRGYDVAIVGSGFAGTILARALCQQGARVLLVERDGHPRFALGESSTPLAGLSLERLAARYGLRDLHHLAAYGRWSKHLPHLRRGLKRGFTFVHHQAGAPVARASDPSRRLLVAASPNDALADSHWLRADVDTHLVARAREEGVDYRDHITLDTARFDDHGVTVEGVESARASRDRRVTFRADVVVDATGPSGFLARALPIADRTASIPVASQLLFAHCAGVPALAALDGKDPYPPHQAAVHHLLGDDGWAYVLPFDHGASSVGLLLRDGAGAAGAGDPATQVGSVLRRFPDAWSALHAGRPLTPWRRVSRVQHRIAQAAGPRWFLLPHAFAFVDPMFSTGMAWSLLAVERLAGLLGRATVDPCRYDQMLQREADQIELLIHAAYQAQGDFERFVSITKLYFATVSFVESQQRLRPAADDAWQGFLAAHDPSRRALFRAVALRCQAGDPDLGAWLDEQIAPFDVIGLDTMTDNRLPVDLDLLVRRADKLGMRREAVVAALPRLQGGANPGW